MLFHSVKLYCTYTPWKLTQQNLITEKYSESSHIIILQVWLLLKTMPSKFYIAWFFKRTRIWNMLIFQYFIGFHQSCETLSRNSTPVFDCKNLAIDQHTYWKPKSKFGNIFRNYTFYRCLSLTENAKKATY